MLHLRHGQLLIPDLVLVVVIARSSLRVFFFYTFPRICDAQQEAQGTTCSPLSPLEHLSFHIEQIHYHADWTHSSRNRHFACKVSHVSRT